MGAGALELGSRRDSSRASAREALAKLLSQLGRDVERAEQGALGGRVLWRDQPDAANERQAVLIDGVADDQPALDLDAVASAPVELFPVGLEAEQLTTAEGAA